jgi:hypothetical protein
LALLIGTSVPSSGPMSSSPAQAAPQCPASELLTKFGEWADEGIVIRRTMPQQPVTPFPGSKAALTMRLLLAVQRYGTAPWVLAVHDTRGHLLALIDREDFTSSGGSLWTGRLGGPSVSVSLRGGDNMTEIEVRGSVAMGQPAPNEAAFSISGTTPTWAPLYPQSEPLFRDAGETVGMLVNMRSRNADDGAVLGQDTWCCSGVMIAKDLFLTNWHCGNGAGPAAWNGEVKQNALVDLAWEDGPMRRQFSVSDVVASDADLDFAILRLKPLPGAEGGIRQATAVAIAPADAALDERVFMIHHAQCLPKRISTRCRVRDPNYPGWRANAGSTSTEISHDCDTEPGASGSPIFDSQGRLIALHHLGFQKAGPSCVKDSVNKAVKISAIAAYLRSEKNSLAQELGW